MTKNNYGYKLESPQYDIISSIVNLTGCNKYLELGICAGLNMREVRKHCNNCIGVDIIDVRGFKDFTFYLMTTDAFFSFFKEKVDIVFIDADHSFEAVKKDFVNSLNILNEFGIIFLHDTDPVDENYIIPSACGDSYKVVDWIESNYSDLNIMTLPVGVAGLTIVNRKNDRRLLKFSKNI